MQTTTSFPAIVRPFSIGRLGRNRLVFGAIALSAITAAVAWQWSWLVASGVAPLLLSVAPCAAMCGLGLCMHRMGGRGCAAPLQAGQPVRETLQTPSATQET
jgi:hypothetical protein